jgi:hypothetical protein
VLIGSTGLLLLTLLVYGSLAPFLGFYFDDWPVIWAYKSQGLAGLQAYFEGSRPFYGHLLSALFPVLGDSALAWQVVAVGVRLLDSIVFFIFLRSLFPMHLASAWLAAALALVYPGFSSQPLAITFSPHHVSFLLLLISFWATVKSAQSARPQIPWIIVSVLTSVMGYLVIDYYVGLEFVRPLIIYYALLQSTVGSARSASVFVLWLPNLLAFSTYVVWRLFIFKMWPPEYDGGTQISQLLTHPGELIHRALDYVANIYLGSFSAWARTLDSASVDFQSGIVVLASWAVGLGAALVGLCVLFVFTRDLAGQQGTESGADARISGRHMLLLGVAALVVCGLPMSLGSRLIRYDDIFEDRYSLSFVFGISILFASVVTSSWRSTLVCYVLSALLLFSAGAHQFRNQNHFRTDWNNLRSIFSQLSWRVPVLVPGTAMLACNLPLGMHANYTAGMLDLLYGNARNDGGFNYWIVDLNKTIFERFDERFPGRIYATSLTSSGTLTSGVRRFIFRGSADRAVVMWISPSGTVRVLDAMTVDEVTNLPNSCRYASHLSSLNRIQDSLPERRHWALLAVSNGSGSNDWQFGYQVADLARQNKDWMKIASIADELQSKQIHPIDGNEWLLFIEGYAMANRLADAIRLTECVLDLSLKETKALSMLWSRMLPQLPQGSKSELPAISSLKERLLMDLPGRQR